MTLSLKQLLIGAVVLALTAFAFGRFSAPEKVKIETKTQIVEVERKETNDSKRTRDDRNQRIQTETFELVRPDGTRETRTKVVESTETTRRRETTHSDSTTRDTSRTEEVSKEVTAKTGKIFLSVMGGVKVTDFTAGPRIGAHVGRNLIGPITIGVWGMNDLSCGLSLGLTF